MTFFGRSRVLSILTLSDTPQDYLQKCFIYYIIYAIILLNYHDDEECLKRIERRKKNSPQIIFICLIKKHILRTYLSNILICRISFLINHYQKDNPLRLCNIV